MTALELFRHTLFGVCFVATGAEGLVARRKGVTLRFPAEFRADLATAGAAFSAVALYRGACFAAYVAVHARFGLELPALHPVVLGLLAFVAYDFLYYVDHRSTHTFGLLWASHRVHHQTRAFHLMTGLRMSVVGPLLAFPFRLPLAVLGVPPALFAAIDALHALSTFFLHARFVGALGRAGLVFNTPAHHRVHHSAQERHFGCNYGGVLIVWDRCFGTYREPEPVTEFGDGTTSEPLGPWRAHVATVRAFLADRRARLTQRRVARAAARELGA